MATIQTYACDICSTQKKNTNRWWKVFLLKGDEGQPAGVVMLEWDINEVTTSKARFGGFTTEDADAHLCGVGHLMEWISKRGIATP